MATPVGIQGPTPIYPNGRQNAITIKNTGDDAVYLAERSIGDPNGGFPLGAKSSMIWDAGKPLYAWAPTGQLIIADNSGNLFDAQAIAGEIIAGGLAQEIAENIRITGTPSINKQTDLYSGLTNAFSSTIPEMDQYNLVHLTFNRAAPTNSVDMLCKVILEWSSQFTLPFNQEIYVGQIGVTELIVPVLGPSLSVSYATGVNVAMRIYGSTGIYTEPMLLYRAMRLSGESYAPRRVQLPTPANYLGVNDDMYGSYSFSLEPVYSTLYNFGGSHRGGNARIAIRRTGVYSGQVTIRAFIQSLSTETNRRHLVFEFLSQTTNNFTTYDIYLPPEPIIWQIQRNSNAAGTCGINLAVSMSNQAYRPI